MKGQQRGNDAHGQRSKSFTMRLPEELIKWISSLSKHYGISKSSVVISILKEKHEKKNKKKNKGEAL